MTNTIEMKVCELLENAGMEYDVFVNDEDVTFSTKTKDLYVSIDIIGSNVHVECETLADDDYHIIETKTYKRLSAIVPFIEKCQKEAASIKAELVEDEVVETIEELEAQPMCVKYDEETSIWVESVEELEEHENTMEAFNSFFHTEEPLETYIVMDIQDPSNNFEGDIEDIREFYNDMVMEWDDVFNTEAEHEAYLQEIQTFDIEWLEEKLSICEYLIFKNEAEMLEWCEEVGL